MSIVTPSLALFLVSLVLSCLSQGEIVVALASVPAAADSIVGLKLRWTCHTERERLIRTSPAV